MPGKKIMVYTIPNEGHFNIIKRLIRRYQDRHSFAVTLVDRHNSAPILAGLTAPVRTLRGSGRYRNTPASRVFQRAGDLLGECVRAGAEFQPDLILYDFCALEGRLAADVLRVPSWCSIPGLIGPQLDTRYLAASLYSPENREAMALIRRRYGLAVVPAEVELISNSLHLPGEQNLLWSYPAVTPGNFLHNRRPARYRFAGYLSDGYDGRSRAGRRTRVVYLSLGTEVMDNLWPAQEETRRGVRTCLAALAKLWDGSGLRVVFSTMGRRVLDRYPANWTVCDRVDQQRILSTADVFVTHGGSNSFHEALLLGVPPVVTPFFGDQVLTGRRVEELGVGIGLGTDEDIDRDKPKHFLTPELAGRIDDAVRLVLGTDRYRAAIRRLPLAAAPPLADLD
ncbi:MAG TPA: glycosyltransferase [Rugosimonospora sp.]|nr:glycosyltransferase [Rugosimonospora sp.]